MTTEIKVPVLPESVADATVAKWHKKVGDFVKRDENLVDLETDKVMLEVPALEEGVLTEIKKKEGNTVNAEEVIGVMKNEKEAGKKETEKREEKKEAEERKKEGEKETTKKEELSPSVRRLISEHHLDSEKIEGTGKDSRITKEDVEKYLKAQATKSKPVERPVEAAKAGERSEKRVTLSRLRARIAERLIEVQQSTAMLTTFNEVNMQPVMAIRARYKDQFVKEHDIKLGFMSFFVKAVVEALKRYPTVNASIDGTDIVYHGYFDIGIAVSTDRGLVVPIIRDADVLSMADIEKQIADYAVKARDGKLTMENMTGGTFTITNGGIFGSMLSTPILNPPQSAILGMHNIVKRPVVEKDQILIRPIMYLALSYDHRIIDGRESVTFLKIIKEFLEDPSRLLLQI